METGELDALRREVMRLFFSIGKQMKRRAAHALRGMPRMDFLTLYLIHDLAKKQGREEIWALIRRLVNGDEEEESVGPETEEPARCQDAPKQHITE